MLERTRVKIFTSMGIFIQQISIVPRPREMASDRLGLSVINNFLYKYSKSGFIDGYEIL